MWSACHRHEFELPPIQPPTEADLRQKFGIDEDLPYIQDDTFINDPTSLLGQVIEIRKVDGKCPGDWKQGKPEFAVVPVAHFAVDPSSVLKTPMKRDSKLITADLAAHVKFLNYLSGELAGNRVISAILFDQAAARAADKDDAWPRAISTWKTNYTDLIKDEAVCYLVVVRGVIQKNLVRRTFSEASGSAAAGAYGVNVDGKYHTSNEDYSVDVRFGLSIGILKRPVETPQGLDVEVTQPERAPTQEELQGAANLDTVAHAAG
jgi:hypothetical protein